MVSGETNDKILVISDGCGAHSGFEIPKCKIIMVETTSINKRVILDLEYADILKYYKTETEKYSKTLYDNGFVVIVGLLVVAIR